MNLNSATIYVDFQGVVFKAGREALKKIQISETDFVGKKISDFIPELGNELVKNYSDFETGKKCKIINPLLPHTTLFLSNVQVLPLLDSKKLTGFLVILGNIERQNDMNPHFLNVDCDSFYEKSPLAYQSLDNKGYILNVNSTWCTSLGYSKDNVIGKWFGNFWVPQEAPIFETLFKKIKEQGYIENQEFRLVKKDGTLLTVSFDGKLCTTPEGVFKKICCIFKDVSNASQTIDALSISKKHLLNISSLTTDYAYSILLKGKGDFEVEWEYGSFEKLAGYPFSQLYGKKDYKKKFHPDDIPQVHATFETIMQGKKVSLECRIITQAGEVKWFQFIGVPEWDDEKLTLVRIFGTVKEITNQKETDLALQNSEKQYRKLFEHMNSAFALHKIITDKKGKPVDYIFLEVNPKFEEMTGLKARDIIGKRVLEVLPDTESSWIEKYAQVALSGESLFFTNYAKELDRYYEVQAYSTEKGYFATTFLDISERLHNENELKEREERFRQLFNNISAGVAIYKAIDNGKDFIIVDVNHAGQKLSQVKRDHIQNKKITEVFPGVKDLGLFNVLQRVWKTGKAESLPLKRYKDARIHEWVENYVFKLPSDLVVALYEDTSDQRKSEQALADAEKKFRTVAEYTFDWEFWTDNKGRNQYVSPSCERISGFSAKEYVDNPDLLFQIILPEDRYLWHEHLAALKSDKSSHSLIQFRIKKKSGEIVWIEHSCQLVFDEDGNSLGHRGSNRDITDRKKQGELVKKQGERLESLFRISQKRTDSYQELLDYALKEAITLTESKIGYIYFYSEEKEQFELHSWSDEAMKQCQVMDVQTVYDLNATGCWGEAVRQRKAFIVNEYSKENPYVRGIPEGHVELEKFLTIPVFSDDVIVAVVGVANKEQDYDQQDIDQLTLLMDSVWSIVARQKAFIEIQSAKVLAEKANRAKSDFLANMSHELRTPMNGILGMMSLIDDDSIDPRQLAFINMARESANHLLYLIEDMLELSRIDIGKITLRPEKFDIVELVSDLLSTLKIRAEEKGLSFVFEYSKGTVDYYGDKHRITQILVNLLTNAIKYSQKGTIYIKIMLEKNLVISVKDEGIGIPANRIDEIFEPFHQLEDPYTKEHAGIGAGLAIVKNLLDLIGGEIAVHSSVDEGSEFIVSLPIRETPVLEKSKLKSRIRKHKDSKIKKLTILVVEDEAINRIYVRSILENSEFTVLEAGNGLEAVDMVERHKPDCVLMDIGLPVLNGIEATKQIKEKPDCKEIPVIAVTAHALQEDRERIYKSGVSNVVVKPYAEKNLIDAIYAVTQMI